MNAGAYGEIAHILVSAQVLTKDGEILAMIDARDMRFGYRRSVLQETGGSGYFSKFNLKPGRLRANIKNEMNRPNHLRELKQPL